MKSAQDLTERLAPLSVDKPMLTRAQTTGMPAGEYRAVNWLQPEMLCDVAFTEWTEDGRIRHPSFQGLREDKSATDVKMEKPASSASTPYGVTITHPSRVLFESAHITKGDLAEYYSAVGPLMLAHIARHPVSVLRCPSGVGGQCFYQRNPGPGLGAEVHSARLRHNVSSTNISISIHRLGSSP